MVLRQASSGPERARISRGLAADTALGVYCQVHHSQLCLQNEDASLLAGALIRCETSTIACVHEVFLNVPVNSLPATGTPGVAIDAAPTSRRGNGLSSFRLLGSEHLEDGRQTSHAFARTIHLV